ncbi:hypothetical protein Tco_0373339 [Tanacetum coccineum]
MLRKISSKFFSDMLRFMEQVYLPKSKSKFQDLYLLLGITSFLWIMRKKPDGSQYTYGPEKTQPSESESQTTELDTCNSNISTQTSELVSEPVVNESNIEVQPKVWSDAPIIKEYESDSDDECVTVQTKGLDTPSFANKQVKTPRENVKHQSTQSQKSKVYNKELGHGTSAHDRNNAYLADYFQDFNGALVAFGGSKGQGNITERGKIKTGKGLNWLFDLDYLTDSMNYHSVRSENQANLHADDLARLQRQEKEANEEAEALKKNLEQETENLVTQAGAAKSSISTASTKTTNSQEDDSEIPPLEDIHEDTTDDSSFDLESYSDSDYARSKSDMKSTTGRLSISWQRSLLGNAKSKPFVSHFYNRSRISSIRTDLIFDDANGIDTLQNQAIFNAIQLMGYEGDLSVQLANISVPLDHFPVNSLTSKVFSFMIKKGKHFSGKVTPLFDTMLVQPTQDEGASSERLSVEQPSPSPAPTGEVPNESLPDSSSA